MEDKDLEKMKKDALENIHKESRGVAEGVVKEAIKEVNSEIDSLKKQLETATKAEDVEALKKDFEDKLDKLSADMKKARQISGVVSTGDSIEVMKNSLVATIRGNEDVVKGFNGGHIVLASKAIDFTSFGNAADYASLTNQNLGLYRNPYNPVYLRNIFPNVSTSSQNLTIWKRGTTTGEAAVWDYGTGEGGVTVSKPEVSPTWEKEVVSVDTIAGLTHVPNQILDDIDFVSTEIPYTLIYGPEGVLAAENKEILNYIKDNAVDYTDPTGFATANSLETVLAAAFGQLGDNYMAPTHILINNWDFLQYLSFNKASGSGQYNYPQLGLSFINNQMFVSNLQAVPATGVPVGTAYVVAAAHSRFVSRKGVELKMSEHNKDNFEKNMITFRAEERAGFFTYNDESLIKVTLPTPSTGG